MPALLRSLLPLATLALLVACTQAEAPAAQTDKSAEGEVLGGTISDSMLPLDQLRSQSPPLRVVPSERGATGSGAGDANAADATDPAPEAVAAPESAAPPDEG